MATTLATTLASYRMQRIRLDPARVKNGPRSEGPGGDGRAAYEFVAPLDPAGHISPEGWRAQRALCFVHRLDRDEIVERGVLVHKPGGAGGATWAFDYLDETERDEDTGYRFGAHAFVPGEYVSIRDEDGALQTFRVTSVGPA